MHPSSTWKLNTIIQNHFVGSCKEPEISGIGHEIWLNYCYAGHILILDNTPACCKAVSLSAFEHYNELMDDSFDERLKRGLLCHLEGHLDEAYEIYNAILDESPENPEALQLAGALVLDRGDAKAACLLLKKAVQLNPGFAPVKINYGIALAACDQVRDALAELEEAITLAPHSPDGYYNAGRVFLSVGRAIEARDMLSRAVKISPSHAVAQNDYAIALQQLGLIEEALKANWEACRLEPGNSVFRANRCSLRLDFDDPKGAVQDGERATSLDQTCKEAQYNLGNAYCALDRPGDARLCYKRAIEIDPYYADAHANLATVELAFENIALALKAAERALALEPAMAEAAWTRSLALLLDGDYERGWAEYEWRWAAVPFLEKRQFDGAEWNGEPVAGKTVLIHHEQGLGDGLQFVRYGALLAEAGARVVLECPSSLVPLFTKIYWLNTVVPLGNSLPSVDLHVALMSLPNKFGTTLEMVPAAVPYLPLPKPRVDFGKFTIGFVWRGSKTNRKGRHRSCSLSNFEILFHQEAVEFISLQTELDDEDRRALKKLGVKEFGSGFKNFLDTAAIVSSVDLVITVDTALAHLVGGMGKPVWILVPQGPDWRWLLEREDSPWYPTARIFRQNSRSDWGPVICRVHKALAAHLQRDK